MLEHITQSTLEGGEGTAGKTSKFEIRDTSQGMYQELARLWRKGNKTIAPRGWREMCKGLYSVNATDQEKSRDILT